MAISGLEFKAKYPTTRFYKLTNENECHNGFQFNDGINIDIHPFNPNGYCCAGGLYFTDRDNIGNWLNYGDNDMVFIREVEIIDDSQVCIEECKYKTDKFILKPRIELKDFSLWEDPQFCELAVQQDGHALFYVKNQTDEICKLAVQENDTALSYVKEEHKTEELCKLAVQQYGWALEYVKEEHKTEELCMTAVQRDGLTLQFVKDQTEKICLAAVQEDGRALKFVKDQSKEICLVAVQQNGRALQFVKDQTEEICLAAIQKDALLYIM